MSQGIDYNIGGDASGANAAIQSVQDGLSGLIGKASLVSAGLGGAVTAIRGLASAGRGLAGALAAPIARAAEMETLETAFIPLLGSVAAARDRIAELSSFAASTPFELPQIATASRTLETLTQGALSTGDGLRLVGDIAAGTDEPFEAIATTVGRLYSGLQGGRPVGQVMARLEELGTISAEARTKIEALVASGAGEEAWAMAEAELSKFGGSMELQSQTWGGLMSTLKDNIGMAMASFGQPIMDAIKPFLETTISAASTLTEKAAAFGQRIGQIIAWVAAAFQTGQLTTIIGTSLELAFQEAVNTLWAGMRGAAVAWGVGVVEYAKTLIFLLKTVTTADFWKGVGNALKAAGLGLAATLMRAISDLGSGFASILRRLGADRLADRIEQGSRNTAQTAEAAARAADAAANRRDDHLNPIFDAAADRLIEAGHNITDAFTTARDGTAPVFDTDPARERLAESFATIRAHIAENTREDLEDALSPIAQAIEGIPDGTAPALAGPGVTPGDRLSQIGGFIGGAVIDMRDRAIEETARWTQATARACQDLLRQVQLADPHARATF